MSEPTDDEPDAGTNVRMPAVRDEAAPETSGSIDVQFSQPGMPAAAPSRRRRAQTIPDRIADSLGQIPVVKEVIPKTRKGRMLVRSVIVAFALVAMWIAAIVLWQLRGEEKPDFRPRVEEIMIDLREGRAELVYQKKSSTRFTELMTEDAFVEQVRQINDVLGRYREVASVIKTQLFRGPSGRTARVEMLLEFEKGRARSSMSFHREEGEWRMVGYSITLPEDVAAYETQEERRRARVEDAGLTEELKALTEQILADSRDGKAGAVHDAAAPIFQDSIPREDFIRLEQERYEALGPFLRVLQVTSSRASPAKTSASLDALLEFRGHDMGTITITGSFKYAKLDGVWKLTFYKLVMPRPREQPRELAPAPEPP